MVEQMETRPTHRGEIYPCSALASRGSCPGTGRGWHVQTYHSPTGSPWWEDETPWYRSKTLAAQAARKASLTDGVAPL